MNAQIRPGDLQAHVPVLPNEVAAAVAPEPGAVVVDGTFGAGNHARAFLAAGARVIGIDRDPAALAAAVPAPGLTVVRGLFGDLDRLAAAHAPEGVDAVALDVGVSSMQLDRAERGFSFQRDGPLDMRMSDEGPTAADLIARLDEGALADVLHRFGEERAARRIARAIVRSRAGAAIETTLRLAAIVAGCLPPSRPGQAHPATRTFQALRIAVNDELGELVRGLAAAERILKPGGRLAVVTFHSLEDRIVKRFLRAASATAAGSSRHDPERTLPPPRFETPDRPTAPSDAEIAANPRARSARLRAAVRTAAPPVDLDPRALGLPRIPAIARGTRR